MYGGCGGCGVDVDGFATVCSELARKRSRERPR